MAWYFQPPTLHVLFSPWDRGCSIPCPCAWIMGHIEIISLVATRACPPALPCSPLLLRYRPVIRAGTSHQPPWTLTRFFQWIAILKTTISRGNGSTRISQHHSVSDVGWSWLASGLVLVCVLSRLGFSASWLFGLLAPFSLHAHTTPGRLNLQCNLNLSDRV